MPPNRAATSDMQVFLVGGAVRDQMLGLPVKERDWVVVGATAEEMVERGFIPVGKHFPVFLHPDTKEEYALARTERKTGQGYHGFVFHTGQDVGLADDLHRRDLTINAMARDAEGTLIDPWGGKRDLERKLLRHVSQAFAEDPVRVLRVSRFLARLKPLGFRVAEETLDLMRVMRDKGEIDALKAERVWREFTSALGEPAPAAFFEVLSKAGALEVIAPELECLFNDPRFSGKLKKSLNTAASLKPEHVFAVLAGWAAATDVMLDDMCERLKAPTTYRRLAKTTPRFYRLLKSGSSPDPDLALAFFEESGSLRNPGKLEVVTEAWRTCEIPPEFDEETKKSLLDMLELMLKLLVRLDLKSVVSQCDNPNQIETAVRKRRLETLSDAVSGRDL